MINANKINNIMDVRDIELNLDDTKKQEDKNMLGNSCNEDEFRPIQRNEKLFKFILNSTKIEMKENSLINMIYLISISEIGLWVICLLLFFYSPASFFLSWVLTIHLAKGIFGLIVLHYMPKTYEVIEKISAQPDFDENTIVDVIYFELKTFYTRLWTENKIKMFTYFILTIIAMAIDISCLIYHIVKSKNNVPEYMSLMILIEIILLGNNCFYLNLITLYII